jgi:hypothetical protein
MGTDNPFGTAPGGSSGSGSSTGSNNGASGSGTTGSGTTGGSAHVPKLFKISSDPVSGEVTITRNNTTYIRYVDRATGHIYDVNPTNLEKVSATNNTLPRIYDALWKSDGLSVIFRTLPSGSDVVENTLITLTLSKSTSTEPLYTVTSTSMRGNVSDMKVGPTNLLAYVLADTGTVVVSNFDGTKPQTIYSSPFTQWRIGWGDSSHVTLTTAASAIVDGFAYSINIKTGSMIKLLGPLSGLTTLTSPDSTHIAYSYNNADGLKSSIENISEKSSVDLLPNTLVEKCAWSTKQKNMVYCGAPSSLDIGEPDKWYQGVTHFSDRIWEFDTSTGFTELLADPKKDFNVDIDIINPHVSPDGKFLIFMNKSDLSLWALTL